MLKKAIIFVLFFFIKCQINDGIIRIPLNKEIHENITTKNGFINYSFFIFKRDDLNKSTKYAHYKLENMKNLNLLNRKINNLEILGDKKNIAHLIFDTEIEVESDRHNIIICELFYQTNYIDKKIYSITQKSFYEPFKFFGGTPLNLIKDLNKFTFNINDTLSEILIFFDWKKKNNKIEIQPNSTMNNSIEFKDDSHLICFSQDIFTELYKQLFYGYKKGEFEYDNNYKKYQLFDLSDSQKRFFPEIKFKIGNKVVSLNKNDLIYEYSLIKINGRHREEDIHNYLFIKNSPCDNTILGLKFFEKFDIREYNLETKEFNLYLRKDRNFITEENISNLNLNSCTHLTSLILFFCLFLTFILFYINHPKIKYSEYLNNYYYDI